MPDKNGSKAPDMQLDPNEGYTTLPDGGIFGWTKNYRAFEFDPSNREIVEARVQEKVKMIQNGKNYLREFPIVVQDIAGKWIVREGQHRLVAAERTDRVVYYFVSDRISSDDVIDINNSQYSWSSKDKLRHFVQKGRPEYLKLQEFMNRHPWLLLSMAINLCHYGDRATMGYAEGTYTANDLEFAEEVAQLALRFKPLTPHYRDAAFVGSLAACLEIQGFSADRLVHKVEMQSGKLKRHGNIRSYMEMWNELYNHWQHDDAKLFITQIGSSSGRRRHSRLSRATNKKSEK